MAQPARRRLRAARRSGLTSPDPVRTPTAATAPEPAPEPGTPDKPQDRQAEAHTQTRLGKLLMQESEPETTYRNRPVDRGLEPARTGVICGAPACLEARQAQVP